MFSLSTLVITAIVGIISGMAAGMLLLRSLSPQEQQNRELENRLHRAEEQLRSYQNDVTSHFEQTSQLVNELTQRYKDVHEHLANSALKLTTADMSRQIIDAGDGKLGLDGQGMDETQTQVEAPKDWAPKTANSTGQLSEEFGLKEDGEPAAEIKHTA